MGQTISKNTKNTKTNENPSPSSSMHKLVPFGSKLVPTWFLEVPMGSIVHRSVPTNLKLFPTCSHAHALFQDRFKDVQVGSRWFSTLYILSPNFHKNSDGCYDAMYFYIFPDYLLYRHVINPINPGVLAAQLVSRHSCVADRLPVVVQFPAGPRASLKW